MFLVSEITQAQKVIPTEAYDLINYHFDNTEDYKLDINVVKYKNEHFNINKLLESKFQGYIGIPLTTLDSVFDEETIKELRHHIQEYSNVSILDKSKLKVRKRNIIFEDKRTEREKQFPKHQTYRICVPIFSQKGQFALLYIENQCGIECGGGQINVYLKSTEEGWQYVFTIPLWVS